MSVRSPIRSPIRSVIRPVIRGLFQRFFTTLASAGSQHFTIPTVTLTGDFRIPFKFSCGAQSTFVVLGQDSSFSNHVSVLPAEVEVRIAGTRLHFTGSFQDGKLHSGEVIRVGSVVTVDMDGVTIPEDTTTGNSSTFTFDRIGQENGTDFSDGINADIEITDAGTLIRKYNIDQDWVGPSTVLVDSSGNGQPGTAVNITDTDAELLTLFTNPSPNEWRDSDGNVIFTVAGT